MEKIALITDSTCGLPEEYIKKYNVYMARLKIIYKDAEYIDELTITADEVYSNLNKELPSTSMPSVEDVNIVFEEVIKAGYTHAIVLPISSGLSGTINSFMLSSSLFKDQLTTFIFDTKHLSMAVGLSLIEVGKLIEAGTSFTEICQVLPELQKKTKMFFTVDTLEYLIKGGRIGKVSGRIGELLNLKPIITMDEDGQYTTFTKVRGSKQAFNYLCNIGTEFLERGNCNIAIMTGTMHEEAEKLKALLMSHPHVKFMHLGTITPAVGIHSGPRLLAIAILSE